MKHSLDMTLDLLDKRVALEAMEDLALSAVGKPIMGADGEQIGEICHADVQGFLLNILARVESGRMFVAPTFSIKAGRYKIVCGSVVNVEVSDEDVGAD